MSFTMTIGITREKENLKLLPSPSSHSEDKLSRRAAYNTTETPENVERVIISPEFPEHLLIQRLP